MIGVILTVLFWGVVALVLFTVLSLIRQAIGHLLYRWAFRICADEINALYDEIDVLQSMVDSEREKLITKDKGNGQLRMNFNVPVADKTRIYQQFNDSMWSISRYDLNRWERGDTLVMRGRRPTWLNPGKEPSKGDKVATDSSVLWRFEYELKEN